MHVPARHTSSHSCFPHAGCSAVCHYTSGRFRGHHKVHARSHQDSSQEGRTESRGNPAVLHQCLQRGARACLLTKLVSHTNIGNNCNVKGGVQWKNGKLKFRHESLFTLNKLVPTKVAVRQSCAPPAWFFVSAAIGAAVKAPPSSTVSVIDLSARSHLFVPYLKKQNILSDKGAEGL